MKKVLSFILTIALFFSGTVYASTGRTAYADTKNHWAESVITKWSDNGILSGYNGEFRPNDFITRADTAVILDRMMDYQIISTTEFLDLDSAYYTDAVLKANAAGVIIGTGDGNVMPTSNITRQDAASMIVRAFNIKLVSGYIIKAVDASSIASYAVSSVGTLESNNIMIGRDDGKIHPNDPITRAEIVMLFDNLIKAFYSTAGTYSEDATGFVLVNTSDVILHDMMINGTLFIAPGVGEGTFTLDNVKVTGDIIVHGGGPNSIKIINGSSVTGTITIEKVGNGIRVFTDAGIEIPTVIVGDSSNCDDIILEGVFNNVIINAEEHVILTAGSSINTLTLNVPGEITGTGIITRANLLPAAAGASFESAPTTTIAPKDMEVTIGGNLYLSNGTSLDLITGGGGVGGGGSGEVGGIGGGGSGGGDGGGDVGGGGVVTPTLSSIAITTPATKTAYTVGDLLDLTGLVVTGSYSDSSTMVETITAGNISGFNSAAVAASQTLTITVSGKMITYNISVAAAPVTLSSIAITTPATKTAYTVGDPLDLTGLVVTGTYSDSSTMAETITAGNISGFNSAAVAASQTLTITVSGKTTTYNISIAAAPVTLSSIAITTPAAKTAYTVGDPLDLTGLVVTGTYSDSSTMAETITAGNISGFNSAAVAASQTLTITVSGKTTTYNISIAAAPVTLSSIAITTPAAKTAYTVGDPLDLTGLVVTGTYSDSSTMAETITAGNISGFNSAAVAASQTLTITVSGKTTTYNISIAAAPVTLSSIAITTPATKTAYTVGDPLDLTGLVVTGTYSDSSTMAETITAGNISGFNSAAATVSQTLTITVGGKTATYNISVAAAPVTLSSITITTPATKTAYTVGDPLDLTGLVVTGSYSDSSTMVETITAGNISGFNSAAVAASQTLTITVSGKTATYNISVAAAPVTLSSIAITTPATKTAYTVGDPLDLTGLVVTGTYSDSSTMVETITAGNISGFNSAAVAASQTLTITVSGKMITYNISVAAAPVTLSSIAITTPATKTAYTVGDPLDLTGLVVTGTYSDSSTMVETITAGNISGFNSAAVAASQTLTITIGGKTATYNISIAAAPVTLSSIAITTPATKTAYTVGDPLDLTGLVVTGTYSDSSTMAETITAGNISGFNSTAVAASQTLTITIGGKTATYNISIAAVPVTLSSIAITTPATKTAYTVGDPLDITGLVVTGTYSDSSTMAETINVGNISGFNSAAVAASQTLTITVGGKTATYNISVAAAPVTLSSIAITTPAAKTAYTVGDLLDITGLVVTGTYSDSSTMAETITAGNISGFNSAAVAASQTLTITVSGKMITYNISIAAVPVTLSSIAITTPATKTAYTVGDPLDITGLVVTGTYSDSSTMAETINVGNISGFNSAAVAASQTLTITVGGKTATYNISVAAAPVTLSSIAITTPATKTAYTVGDPLDLTGLVVTGTYSDSSTMVETITAGNISGFNSAAVAASQTLTITVSGKMITYNISVAAAPVTLSSIAITTPATKTAYTVGDPLDLTGLVVTGTYSDSSTMVETITAGNISGFNSAAVAASQTLTITIGGKTATYNISVAAPVITGSLTLVGEVLGVKSYQIQITGAAPEDVTQVLVNSATKTFQIIGGVVRFNSPSTTVVASVQIVVLGQTINVPTGIITATATLVGVVFGIESYNVQVTGATPEDVTQVLVNNVSNPFEVIAGLVRVNSGTAVTSIKIVALGQTIEVQLP